MYAIRHLSAGESHGPELTVILEGLPSGLVLSEATLAADLKRRREGLGTTARMSIETDETVITGGVMAGRTTGAPIAIRIVNRDFAAWQGKVVAPMTVPRPGHADFAAAVKYGYDDLRLSLERASARETATRVAVGACCRAFLGAFGIRVTSKVIEIGGHAGSDEEIGEAISSARKEGETLGGVTEVRAEGVPVGLGSHVAWDRRLDGRLAHALFSVPAVKGVELGGGFSLARMKGTATDGLFGGIDGGISNGEPIVLRVAMKPIPTTLKPRPSFDMATGVAAETSYQRSDVCPVPRAGVIFESEVCRVLADALIEKLGGDSMNEMLPRFAALPKTRQLVGKAERYW